MYVCVYFSKILELTTTTEFLVLTVLTKQFNVDSSECFLLKLPQNELSMEIGAFLGGNTYTFIGRNINWNFIKTLIPAKYIDKIVDI